MENSPENSDVKENSPEGCNVKVALHIRPLLSHEKRNGGEECLSVMPGTAQVLMGTHSFIYDHVYGGGGGSPSSRMFEECVAPLLDDLFKGYNGTVIAYGQTGSGKTYTMGTGAKSSQRGLVTQVMSVLFNKIESLKHQTEFQLHVSFIEIIKEEVRDLLDLNVVDRLENGDGHPENAVPGKQPIQIRKASDGAVSLSGSTEVSVSTQKEMRACLDQGCMSRSTASTDMNSQSSRSHAIFTIILEQKDKSPRVSKGEANANENAGEEYRCAKLHLVDLAGSERAKRTGCDGLRLKEGIQINKGLLALGNVISALGDEKKRKEGLQHIPYRDSKLTRLLQASLGGNCKTVMIACVSPADYNAEETLNTLKYANRARNIQNKPSVHKDLFSNDMQKLRQQIRYLQAELAHRRDAELVEVEDLNRKIDWLETTNSELLQKLHEYRNKCAVEDTRVRDAQEDRKDSVKKDGLKRGSESMTLPRAPKRASECMTSPEALERGSECMTSPEAIVESVRTGDIADEILNATDKTTVKQEHEIQQNILHKELNDLNKRLEQKESEMKFFESPDVEAIKKLFGSKIMELEDEKRQLQLERDSLRAEIARLVASGDSTAKVETMNTEKLEAIEVQITELEKKQEHQIEVLKQKSHDASKKLQDEIRYIKAQKVQLQQKMKQEEEKFRQWKTTHEKQLLQLKKEGRKSEFERHKLHALYQRQTQVLQRKTEEAAKATKKLKELLELRKAATRERESNAQPSGNKRSGQIKTLRRWLNLELEKVMHVHKLRIDHEKHTQRHAKLAEELSFLKRMDKPDRSRTPSQGNRRSRSSLSPNTRASRILTLENKVKTSSATLASLASQISEAGRGGHDPSSLHRWKMLHSLGDAKELLAYIFSIATDTRRQLWAKEKEIKEIKVELDELKANENPLAKKWREMEAEAATSAREGLPPKRWREMEEQAAAIASGPSKTGRPPLKDINLDNMDVGSPVSFPESKQRDYKPAIWNRPIRKVSIQTRKMVPIWRLSMKKVPLVEQKGKISRWRRSQDEWLIQFKWRWQKPWKLAQLVRMGEEIRNSDETLVGQDLALRFAQTT